MQPESIAPQPVPERLPIFKAWLLIERELAKIDEAVNEAVWTFRSQANTLLGGSWSIRRLSGMQKISFLVLLFLLSILVVYRSQSARIGLQNIKVFEDIASIYAVAPDLFWIAPVTVALFSMIIAVPELQQLGRERRQYEMTADRFARKIKRLSARSTLLFELAKSSIDVASFCSRTFQNLRHQILTASEAKPEEERSRQIILREMDAAAQAALADFRKSAETSEIRSDREYAKAVLDYHGALDGFLDANVRELEQVAAAVASAEVALSDVGAQLSQAIDLQAEDRRSNLASSRIDAVLRAPEWLEKIERTYDDLDATLVWLKGQTEPVAARLSEFDDLPLKTLSPAFSFKSAAEMRENDEMRRVLRDNIIADLDGRSASLTKWYVASSDRLLDLALSGPGRQIFEAAAEFRSDRSSFQRKWRLIAWMDLWIPTLALLFLAAAHVMIV